MVSAKGELLKQKLSEIGHSCLAASRFDNMPEPQTLALELVYKAKSAASKGLLRLNLQSIMLR